MKLKIETNIKESWELGAWAEQKVEQKEWHKMV